MIEPADKPTRDFLEAISLHSPVGMYVVQDGHIRHANPKFCQDTGYTLEQLLKMNSLDIVHPADRDAVRKNAILMLKGELTAPYEFKTITSDGSTHWAMESVSSMQFEGKRAVLGVYMDITERKRIGEALQESEERFRRIAEHVPDAIFRLRLMPSVSLEYISPAIETMTGYTPEECRSDPPRVLGADLPENAEVLRLLAVQNGQTPSSPIWHGMCCTRMGNRAG